MIRISDIYKQNETSGTKMLSDFPADFWEDYRTNYTRYDKVFRRMFYSFYYFMQSPEESVVDVSNNFREDVYNHLLMNEKKYEELFRIQEIPDEDYSLTNNYDVTEHMEKDGSEENDNTYGQRLDSGSYTKGARQDGTTTNIGAQSNTKTESVSPYDSAEYANHTRTVDSLGAREDGVSFNEGQQLDSSSNTKGSQTDDLNKTYSEDYTLTRVGNIGVQTATDMIKKHKDFWDQWSFYEYIFKEICRELLLI